jgi:RimJ/RimL family protein N-acetyltransferase
MNHPRTPRLEFRHYSEDEKHLFLGLMTDHDVMRYVGDRPLTKEAADGLWNRLKGAFHPHGKTTIWAMFAITDGEFIRHASLRPRPVCPDEWEIGYVLKKQASGGGFGTETTRELVRNGFAVLNLKTVFATVDEEHDSSIKVLEKAGLRFHWYDQT